MGILLEGGNRGEYSKLYSNFSFQEDSISSERYIETVNTLVSTLVGSVRQSRIRKKVSNFRLENVFKKMSENAFLTLSELECEYPLFEY